jgi:predicted SAM-dependent methyltransferase
LSDRLRTVARALLARLSWQRSAFRYAGEPAPIYPVKDPTAPAGVRVHLGPGNINLQGWINVDARDLAHVHVQSSSLALETFTDGAVAVIYLCHVLEHVSFAEATELLRAFHRKLAVGGILIISVPDFDALVTTYQATGKNLESIKHALMGGQGYEYNFHKSVYTRPALEALLRECGFADVQPWETETEFGGTIGDWSSERVDAGNGKTIPISLNLKARKVV